MKCAYLCGKVLGGFQRSGSAKPKLPPPAVGLLEPPALLPETRASFLNRHKKKSKWFLKKKVV